MRAGDRSAAGAGLGASGALGLITTVFLFQTLLENFFYKASYIDEAIAALFLGYFVLDLLMSAEIRMEDLLICCFSAVVVAAGLYGNFRFGIQGSKAAILIDIVSHLKFACLFLGVSAFCRVNRVDYRSAIRLPVLLAKAYLAVLFAFGALNLVADIGMHAEIRYGLRVYSFIFGTPGIVTNTVLFIITLLLLECALKLGKGNRIWLAMAEVLLILVIKSRSLILAMVFAALYVSLIIEKKHSLLYRGALILAAAGVIGYPQFEKYFVNGVAVNAGHAPRLLFLEGGIQLFKEYFPFGTGFGTFGSGSAAKYYSQLYYDMGFDAVEGMSPEDPKCLNDTFWPMILAQLGLFGTIAYVLLLFGILLGLNKRARKSGNYYIRLATLFYAVNVLVSSIQSNYPGNNSMCMLTFLVTMMPFAVSAAGPERAAAAGPEAHNGY
ncbi:MAG: hypothetical protein IJ198_02905 [Lachnospiraceae bacterium]|nr:hypothetical protein [Lachnospiraceae bacterium]